MAGLVVVLALVAFAAIVAAMNKGMEYGFDRGSMFISALSWVGGIVVACVIFFGGIFLVIKILFT